MKKEAKRLIIRLGECQPKEEKIFLKPIISKKKNWNKIEAFLQMI